MRNMLRRCLAALLAALVLLPCCGVAEESFYEANKSEINSILKSIETFMTDSYSGILCATEHDNSFDDFSQGYANITTPDGEYRIGVTFFGSSTKKGVEQIFINADFDSSVLRDDDYIVSLLTLPYWGLAYLDMETGKSVVESEVEKAWNVIMGYVFGEDMHSNYFYEYDKQHWLGVKFFQPSSETDPYTGALYCHVNLK